MNITQQPLTHEYLTISQVRQFLNISQSKAYELTHRKDFPVCRFGGSIRIPRDPFMSWVAQKSYIPQNLNPVA